ncbi:MAG: hypothetical protein ACLQGP_20060 [Isosphaeraceae bacterium]
MKHAKDGQPEVGSDSKQLGVRVAPNPNADVDLDEKGDVILNGKGMSVAENWRDLLPHLIPKRLQPIFSGAAGSNRLACFRFGQGPFAPGYVNGQLSLILKEHDPHAGNVVPARAGPECQFQGDLAATRGMWTIDET